MIEEKMIEQKVWAVVGANQDEYKYGNIIFNHLKGLGYEVYPVNPRYDNIEGHTCYKDLKSLPVVPDVINMVVRPEFGADFIKEAAELGVKYVWFQPGTHDETTQELINKYELTSTNACVLVVLRYSGS